ncbi:hypothetical protein QMN58_24600, partial [Escherichia coli]|nr:hypothetical protein [Escherichia coli]
VARRFNEFVTDGDRRIAQRFDPLRVLPWRDPHAGVEKRSSVLPAEHVFDTIGWQPMVIADKQRQPPGQKKRASRFREKPASYCSARPGNAPGQAHYFAAPPSNHAATFIRSSSVM